MVINAEAEQAQAKSWRDVLRIHPAAELFPMINPDELRALAEDIKKNGLKSPIVLWATGDNEDYGEYQLLDGRNRLAAMELVGLQTIKKNDKGKYELDPSLTGRSHLETRGPPVIHLYEFSKSHAFRLGGKNDFNNPQRKRDVDPIAYVISANIHRRHLTAEQKRDLIAKLLKRSPEKSDRQIAETIKTSPTTVGKVRKELEGTGDVSKLDTRTDSRGRKQQAHKPEKRATGKAAGALIDTAPVSQVGEKSSLKSIKDSLVTGVAMHPYTERGLDLYETPPVAVHALLNVEPLAGKIWEPACGPGAIVRVLRDARHKEVVATDIKDYGCPDARCVDFLDVYDCFGANIIVTNPPYRLANKFVRHALKLVPRVVMLLPLRFLEGTGRSDILDGGHLARVYVFRNRLPMMHRDGWRGAKIESGAIAFAWFVWDRQHSGHAMFHRISWKAHADAADDNPDSIPPFLRREAAP